MGVPGVHNLVIRAPIFIFQEEMGASAAVLHDMCACVRKVLSVPECRDVQMQHDELVERLAHMEVLTRRYHMQPGGLSKHPPEPSFSPANLCRQSTKPS